jgi:hypothetical protein
LVPSFGSSLKKVSLLAWTTLRVSAKLIINE